MPKFKAIEGLRGWLAWIVVFSHLASTSDIYAKGLGPEIVRAGSFAVLVFIIISGFVITHLITEKSEPYRIYLFRRFMRIFPLFAITCAIGFFTNDIQAYALSKVPWSTDPEFADGWLTTASQIANSNHDFFYRHAIAHVTMLHGAISNTILPLSQYAFNAPAWSVSLEWQFYLLAPFILALLPRQQTLIWIAAAVALLEIAYRFQYLGTFFQPSFLPGAAGYFAVGIASRLAYSRLSGCIRQPNIILAMGVVLIPLGWDAAPIWVWTIVMAGIFLDRRAPNAVLFSRLYHCALESRAAAYFGSRSYSTYLCHVPVVAICHLGFVVAFPSSMRAATFLGLCAMVLPATILASELFYRIIERPGIALGSILTRAKMPAPVHLSPYLANEDVK